MLMKQIADAPENVAAIVKRNRLQRSCNWYARFQIDNRERVATNRNGKGIEKHLLLLLIEEWALRKNYLARAGFLKTKSPQRCRTAGKKSFTDRKRQINLIYATIAVAIARIEKICQAECCVASEDCSAKCVDLVISAISSLQAAKGSIATQLSQCNSVINVEETAAGCVQLIVAADFAGSARFLIGIADGPQQAPLASFARVAHK